MTTVKDWGAALRTAVLAGIAVLVAAAPAQADKRVALVIGNGAYRNVARLDNPPNDAKLIAETLRSLGFTLIGGGAQINLDKSATDRAVQAFGAQARGADVGLFYYAGHGVQVRGANYLVPIDANPTNEADVDFQMLDTNLVLRQMDAAGTKLNLVVLDACRNNPFGGRGLRATGGGLAQMQAPEGTLISFATQPGNVAQDGSDGDSPYSKALAETIKRPGLGIFDAFNEIGLAVKRTTGGAQQPWVSSSPIAGAFFFSAPTASGPAPAAGLPRDPCSDAAEHWRSAEAIGTRAAFEDHLARFPSCMFSVLAKARLDAMTKTAALTPVIASPTPAATLPPAPSSTPPSQSILPGPLQALIHRKLPTTETPTAASQPPSAPEPQVAALPPSRPEEPPPSALPPSRPIAPAASPPSSTGGEPAPTDCDRLAAHPTDPGRLKSVPGVSGLFMMPAVIGIEPEKAIPACEAAVKAQPNVARLVFQLGRAYESTAITVSAPADRARDAYQRAANMGYPRAMTELGRLYQYGMGGEKDIGHAIALFNQAMGLGDPRALWMLGELYLNGYGVKKDAKKARELFEKAGDTGEYEGWHSLATMYGIRGFGVPVDKAKEAYYEKLYADADAPWHRSPP